MSDFVHIAQSINIQYNTIQLKYMKKQYNAIYLVYSMDLKLRKHTCEALLWRLCLLLTGGIYHPDVRRQIWDVNLIHR